jgi:putative hydrolase of the HAD superfamily
MAAHGLKPDAFLDYVHDVDLSVLTPEPALRTAIAALPGRKLIFTNGSRGHIKNVTEYLNLADLFDGGFAIEDAHYVPKPNRSAYETFNDVFDIDPKRSLFFEDTLRNLEVPKQMGMQTVFVTSDCDATPDRLWVNRPDGSARQADWVDAVTDDLADWLAATIRSESVASEPANL